MSHVKIGELLKACEEQLLHTRDVLNEGNAPNMEKFQSVIDELCEEIGKLPKEEAVAYQEHLQALNDALSAIGTIMQQRRQVVEEELKNLQDRGSAHKAYKSADTGKDDE